VTGTQGCRRQLAKLQVGKFQVEQHVRIPAGGGILCYLRKTGRDADVGPNWSAGGGKFWVLEGPNEKWVDTGIPYEFDKWYKVILRIDVPNRRWEFLVNDRRFSLRQPLGFRAPQVSLDQLDYGSPTPAGFYLDAVRVTRLPDDALVGVFTPGPGPPLPPDHIASTGFNSARGLHGDPKDGPFPLDVSNREGGHGEPGWVGPWLAHPDASFQSKVVFEGDGALYLKGRANFGPNYGRQLAKAQTGRFQVEHHVQVPAGSRFGAYAWQHPGGADWSGPTWGAGGGTFFVHATQTGIKCVPGKWYKVTLRIDVAKHTWEFFVDGKRFESPKPLGFRGKVNYLDYINFLVEGGVYIDDLRVTRLPDAEKDP
jgi:hypothetical protein